MFLLPLPRRFVPPLVRRSFLLCCLLPLAVGCQNEDSSQVQLQRFPVTAPVRIDTVYYSTYITEIQSLKNVEIRARVKGYMDEIHVDEGKKVKKGQLLFSISSQEYKEEVLKAKAMLKNAIAESKSAELNVENVRLLVSKNTVSKAELAIAEAKLEAMKAKIEEMEAHEASTELRLAYTQVRAPFDGVIDRIPFKVGSLIDEGSLLTTISDNTEMFAYFNISEREYLDFFQNMKNFVDEQDDVGLILANNTEYPHDGGIETIEGEFDSSIGSIAFRARFPNPDLILKHGASGKIRLKRKLKKVLIIPQKSTFEIQDKIFVFVVDAQKRIRMQPFKTYLRIPHLYVVSEGLSTQDRILYEGQQNVREGMQIEPEFMPLPQIVKTLTRQ